MTATRFAIVGTGKVAHFHARAIAEIPGAHLVAVSSRRRAQAEAFAAEYADDDGHVAAYDDLEAMLENENIDVVCICSPHPTHRDIAVAAIRRRAHVLIEKPLATTVADCDAMISAAASHGVRIGTVGQRRWYAPSMRIRHAIDAGKLGRPAIASVQMHGWRDEAYYDSDPWRGTWEGEGGGVLVNQAPHQLDLLLWYMGEAERVYGVWRNVNHPSIEVDDTAVATITFRGGGVATVLVSNSQNPALYGRVLVHGDNGASAGVQTDGGAMFIAGVTSIAEAPFNDVWTIPGELDRRDAMKAEDEQSFFADDAPHRFHRLQIEDFLEAIRDDRAPLIDGTDGRRVVELIEAIYKSSRTGLPVDLPLPRA